MPPVHPALPRLAPLALAAWVVGLSILPPSATRIDTWPAAGWLFAGWLVMIGLGWMRAQTVRLGGRRDLALVAFGLITIASAWASPWRGGSLAASTGTVAGVALVYVLVSKFRRPEPERERLQAALDISAVSVIAAGLLFWIWPVVRTGFTNVGDLAFRNDFPFGHVNYTAGAALLAASWLAAGAIGAEASARRWRAAGAGLGVVLIVSSGSRAGVAAVAGGVGIFLISLWLRRGRRSRDAIVGAVLLLIVTGSAVLTNERLRSLVFEGRWSALAAASNTQRTALATAAIELGAGHGLLGPGPGTTPLAYGALAGKSALVGAPDGTLQVWATTGAAGALALALLIGAFLPAVFRALGPSAPLTQAALAAGLLAYAAFALTDHQLDVPFIAVFLLAHVARLAAPRATEVKPVSHAALPRKLVLAAVVIAIAGPVVYRSRDVAARAAFAGALHAHDSQQPVGAMRALGHAHRLAPWDRFYPESMAAWQWIDPATQTIAADALRLAIDPADPWPSEFALYNLAWLELQLGQGDATDHFAAAARLAPHRRGVHLGYALACLRRDDTLAAIRALARECLANPAIVSEAWWQEARFQALIPAVSVSIATQANQLAATLPDDAERNALRASASLIAWWLQPDQRSVEMIASTLAPEPAARLRSLASAPAKGTGLRPGADAWGLLAQAWATGTAPGSIAGRQAGELNTRLSASTDFLAFVTAPLGESAASWRRAERTLRGGHRVIMRHPDSLVAADVPLFERNLLLAPHAAALFPTRGWIPGKAWHDAGLLP
jgi:hypothetical protein